MKIDIQIDNNTNDLVIQNGDFVIAEADKTQAKFIILASKGEIRQYPLLGVGINRFIGSSIGADILFNTVKNELLSDGLSLDSFNLKNNSGGNVEIDFKLN